MKKELSALSLGMSVVAFGLISISMSGCSEVTSSDEVVSTIIKSSSSVSEKSSDSDTTETISTKNVTTDVIIPVGCEHPAEGVIEFTDRDGADVTIDFGDGTCDSVATKTTDGVSEEIDLDEMQHHHDDVTKDVTTEVLIPIGCEYPVSGVVEYTHSDGSSMIIDYGDGTCDSVATKTEDGEESEIDLSELEGHHGGRGGHGGEHEELTKSVTTEVVTPAGCDYPTEGVIEFTDSDDNSFTIDYGDGTCDSVATKTEDGESEEIDLSEMGHGHGSESKTVTTDVVIPVGCEYPASGVIEFTDREGDEVTIDYGDGTCDSVATKTVDGESDEIDLSEAQERPHGGGHGRG
jgi:hypothetical protein